jgi:hypothetical protein
MKLRINTSTPEEWAVPAPLTSDSRSFTNVAIPVINQGRGDKNGNCCYKQIITDNIEKCIISIISQMLKKILVSVSPFAANIQHIRLNILNHLRYDRLLGGIRQRTIIGIRIFKVSTDV